MKAKKKPKHFWMTRDGVGSQCYNTFKKRPPPSRLSADGYWTHWCDILPSAFVEGIGDPSVHLEPGKGPIKVKLVRAP